MNEPLWQAVASIYLIVWFGSLSVFLFAGEPWATIAGGIWIIICMTFGQKFGQK
jgi:hypothetical protein